MGLDVFLQGLVAGYGIAIPIGPIAVLIIELGVRRGFSVAFCAGAGAASADLVYATIASLAGMLLVSILRPYIPIIHTLSALVLIALGIWLLYSGSKTKHTRRADGSRVASRWRAYGLVLANPAKPANRSLLYDTDSRAKIKHQVLLKTTCYSFPELS